MSHTQHDTTKLLSMVSFLSFCLIFSSGSALILSYTPSHYLSSSFLSTSFSSSMSLLRHVISLGISHLLPEPFCSFRFHNNSTPSFHFDILHSLHLLTASMNISLVSTPYIYLFLIGISLSFSPCMPICPYLLSPRLSSHKGRAQREEPEMVNCLAAALSTTPFPLKPDEGSKVKE